MTKYKFRYRLGNTMEGPRYQDWSDCRFVTIGGYESRLVYRLQNENLKLDKMRKFGEGDEAICRLVKNVAYLNKDNLGEGTFPQSIEVIIKA